MKTRLTSTGSTSLRNCLRRYYLRFELGLSRIRQATPLRFGGAFHYGQELYNAGLSADLAIETACCDYATCPDWADPTGWAVERETLAALLAGHFWRILQEASQGFIGAAVFHEVRRRQTGGRSGVGLAVPGSTPCRHAWRGARGVSALRARAGAQKPVQAPLAWLACAIPGFGLVWITAG